MGRRPNLACRVDSAPNRRSFRTNLASDAENRNRLLALQKEVPKRKCHEPTRLGCVRRSAIPFMAYIDRTCPAPIKDGMLDVTREWALGCFLPAYQAARTRSRNDPQAIVKDITNVLLSRWVSGPHPSLAAVELERRVRLAVAVLLRQDGYDVPMPVEPGYPSPSTQMHPAWIRALMTGWPA